MESYSEQIENCKVLKEADAVVIGAGAAGLSTLPD